MQGIKIESDPPSVIPLSARMTSHLIAGPHNIKKKNKIFELYNHYF